MFFLFSKLLSFLISPFNWLVLIVLAYIIIKRIKVRKYLKISFLIVFFTFSYQPIILFFISGWEVKGMKIEEVGHYDVGVVLGGGFEYDNDRERLSIRRGGDRVWNAIQLYHLGKLDYILLSGKNGDLTDKGLDESSQLKEILVANGIPSNKILVDSESMNTFQNAVNSKVIIDEVGANKVLLITSALHMKRAYAVFEKQGIECDAFSTDFYSGGYSWDQFIFPSMSSFGLWDKYLHEVLGYSVYGLTGKL